MLIMIYFQKHIGILIWDPYFCVSKTVTLNVTRPITDATDASEVVDQDVLLLWQVMKAFFSEGTGIIVLIIIVL